MLTIYCLQSDSPQGFDAQAFRWEKEKKRGKKIILTTWEKRRPEGITIDDTLMLSSVIEEERKTVCRKEKEINTTDSFTEQSERNK